MGFCSTIPAVMRCMRAEKSGSRSRCDAARMFVAQHRLAVPQPDVHAAQGFGFGSSIMAMNPFDGQTITLAFPSITLGAMPAGSEGSAVPDAEERARLAAEQANASINAANRLAYDAVIDPRELRNALLAGLSLAAGRRTVAPSPRSGGILP